MALSPLHFDFNPDEELTFDEDPASTLFEDLLEDLKPYIEPLIPLDFSLSDSDI